MTNTMTTQSTITDGPTPVLTDYDIILVNTSAGKDSQTILDVVAKMARRAGVEDRVVVVHADLGERVEWEGTGELAAEQAAHYGFRFEVVRNEQHRDLLAYVEDRAAKQAAKQEAGEKAAPSWPSSTTRWCTSDFKTGPVRKLMTALVREQNAAGVDRQVRILNVLGIRAEESSARAKKVAYEFEGPASNGKRHVDRWLPIHNWTEVMVWANIKRSGVRYHHAYDLGMTRLSCKFCVLGSQADLTCAIKANPVDAAAYVAVEDKIEALGVPHRFTHARSMKEAVAEAGINLDDEDAERRARWAANKRASRARLAAQRAA